MVQFKYMGVVFSPEQIANRQIPDDGAHQRAGHYLLGAIENGRDELPSLRGAMVYGSTTFGRATRRSDLDILTILDPELSNQEVAVLSDLYADTYKKFQVEPEPSTLIIGDNATPQSHQLNAMFLRHLRYTQDTCPEWAINQPVDLIPCEPLSRETALRITIDYCSYKERRLLKSRFSRELNVKQVQRSFELPSAIARKAIQAFSYNDTSDPAQLGRDELTSRARTLLAEQTDCPDASLTANDRLLDLDQEYSSVLDQAVDEAISPEEYSAWISGHALESLDSARVLATSWKIIIERLRQEL